MTKLTFAYSPCPNDTFMFEAIYNKRIDTRGIEFEIIHDEVEQLNKAAFQNKYDISKLSFNAYTKLIKDYQLLKSGAALGENCGPVLISKENIPLSELKNKRIAIPGYNTTAYLMLSLALPHVKNTVEIVFSDIEKAILSGEVDAGLIIHETRFTYVEKGLVKLLDVGEYWEETTHSPIPLGGIALKRSLPEDVKKTVSEVLKDSVQYAFDHKGEHMDYIKCHAQEMDPSVMLKHIDLYVNEYSVYLGAAGQKSIQLLVDKLVARGDIKMPQHPLFV